MTRFSASWCPVCLSSPGINESCTRAYPARADFAELNPLTGGKIMTRALVLAVFLFSGGLSQSALAAYSSLFVFGDSLSDSGNAFILSGGWPPSPPYAGRLSNGPVAVEHLADSLGVPLLPSAIGGQNYAVGGALTDTRNFSFETQFPFPPIPQSLQNTGIATQVQTFVSDPPAFNPAESLFVLWGGANDFFLALERGTDPAATLVGAISNLATSLQTLIGAGAANILVPNLPNLGLTPFAREEGPEAQQGLAVLTNQFNLALAQTLAQIRAATGANIIDFDVAALLEQVVANPAAFGFTNVTEACLDINNLEQLIAGCPGFLFFDQVHPSAAAHQLLGNLFFAEVTDSDPLPEPSALSLLAVALLAAFAVAHRARSGRLVRRATEARFAS